MKIQRSVTTSPVEALDALVRSLVVYEQRHHMSSVEFYERLQNDNLGDSADFVEWAGDYQHYLQLKEELEQRLVVAG